MMTNYLKIRQLRNSLLLSSHKIAKAGTGHDNHVAMREDRGKNETFGAHRKDGVDVERNTDRVVACQRGTETGIE